MRLSVLTPLLLVLVLLLTVCDHGRNSISTGESTDSSVPADPTTTASTSNDVNNRTRQGNKRVRRHLFGLDISDEQNYPLDSLQKFQDSLSFIIAKATGGKDFVDKRFNQTYWQKIKEMGFTRGAYHFYFVWDDPVVQAHHFANTVGKWAADDLPPMVDFEGRSFHNFSVKEERDYNIATEKVQRDLLTFLDTLEAITGRLPLIYVNQLDADKYLNTRAFTKYPLWIADPYTGRSTPRLAGSWTKWAMWQKDTIQVLSDRDKKSATDLDEFHGNAAAFQRFLQHTKLNANQPLVTRPNPGNKPSVGSPVTDKNRPVAPRPGKLYGIDISDDQTYSLGDLEAFKDSLSFVIVKASAGMSYVDKRFRAGDWQSIKDLGFTRGAYHFYYVWDDPIGQAHKFLSTVGSWAVDDLPPIVDFEGHSFYNFREKKKDMSIPIERVQQQLLQFLVEVKIHSERLPMIYTNRSNANKYLDLATFNEYPLWIADPNNNGTVPLLPENWKDKGWTIWQRGYIFIPNKGATHTDFNEFNGNALTLRRFLRSTQLPQSD